MNIIHLEHDTALSSRGHLSSTTTTFIRAPPNGRRPKNFELTTSEAAFIGIPQNAGPVMEKVRHKAF
jgi:hypothetical protein